MARALGRLVNNGVNNSLVHSMPQNARGAVDERFNEYGCIKFVDVILVHHRVVETAESPSDLLRQFGFLRIKKIGQVPTEKRQRDGDAHQKPFRAASSRLSYCARCFGGGRQGDTLLKHRCQKMFEAIADTDQSAE